jgi:hypothetical protein
LRSRKPMKIKFVRKVEMTEEEKDYIKYVVNIWVNNNSLIIWIII